LKVYLAGEQFAGVEDKVKRRLFSYWYNQKNPKHIEKAFEYGQDLFLDSGAFSAFTLKKEIHPVDYAQFVHENKHMFTTISSLDDIGNAQGSYDKLKELEALGCKVQPVYHAREDESWLKKYLDEGYDYIFIGGMVPETTGWLRLWLDDLFDRILCNSDGTARVKLHGFGLTDQQLMFRYPWHSVDSTSWLFTGSFGCCVFLTPQGLQKIVFSTDSPSAKKMNAPFYSNLAANERANVDKWLEPFGVTAKECSEHYKFRNVVNSTTFAAMESMATTVFHKPQRGLFDL
jgi:hypothetical protein